jgi:hypothetical protein
MELKFRWRRTAAAKWLALCGVMVAAVALLGVTAMPASATIQPGYHQLQNKSWPECLDVLGANPMNGAEVGVWHCVNAANQRWQMESLGNGFSRLRVEHTKKCLSARDGTSFVVQDACEDRPDQQWMPIDMPNGWTQFISLGTGKCLEKYGWDVTVFACQNVAWQQWQSLG